MKKVGIKKILVTSLVLLSVGVLTACGSKEGDKGSSDGGNSGGGKKSELVVWTFTDELKTMIQNYYEKSNPDLGYKIKIVTIPTDQYETKIDPIIGTKDAPDVIALESAFVKKYVESGLMADIGALGLDEASKDVIPYVKEVGSSKDGVLRALAWQAAPGGFFYRDSLAKKYLGANSPEEAQKLMGDYNAFYETAKVLKEKSNGSVYMISSIHDIAKPFFGQRQHGWVEDNKLVIDDSLNNLLEVSRKFVSEKLTQDTEGQSEAWFAGMNGDSIMGYSLPTWGLHYWLKPNAVSADKSKTTEGDWRMIQGPTSFFWGGTWVGLTEQSKMKEEGAELVKYLTTNADFLKTWAKETGDFVSSQTVVDEIKGDYKEEFLGGQNHYAEFSNMAQSINAKILTEYDQTIEKLFMDSCLAPYSKGEVEKDKAMKDFKDAVVNAYPDLEVK